MEEMGAEMTVRVWNKESIQALLASSDYAVGRAVLAIYARQTRDERLIGGTVAHNSRGFSGSDGEWLSRIARDLEEGGRIRAMDKVRTHMMRYWRQLVEVANENEALKVEKGELCNTRN